MKNGKPILITGSHRSGSTWIGRTLALSSQIGYIHEPFNPDYYPHQAGTYTSRFASWFAYVCEENEGIYGDRLAHTLNFDYDVVAALQSLFSDNPHRSLAEPARIVREYLTCTKNRFRRVRPLVKDPIALFSAEWLARKFDMDVTISIRHPAAFVGSLKVAGWDYPFAHFLQQELLINGFLAPFKEQIQDIVDREPDVDAIDKAALLWNIMHYRILKYQQAHPDWLFVRHEDLSLNPLKEFEFLFDRLNLEYTESIQKAIARNTSGKSQDMTKYSRKATRTMNSQANVKSWQKRLTPPEVSQIRERVGDISAEFYTDADWE